MSEKNKTRTKLVLFYFFLASAMMWKLFLGQTYYPGDVLYSHPLWYDGVHSTSNYDLIDSIALYYSHDTLFNQELKQGRFLTWNPYSFSGHPVYSDGKSGWLYPPRFALHALFSSARAHDLLLWLHFGFAGCAMHLFLKRLGLLPRACVMGSTVWMLNGLQAVWLQSEYAIIFGVWLPLALERLLVGLQGRSINYRALLGCTFCFTMMGFCGLIQFWAHSLLLCGFWVLYLSFGKERPLQKIFFGVASLAAAIPVTAVQLVPLFELVGRSQRQVRPLEHQISCFRNLLEFLPLNMLSPNAVGNPSRGLAFKFVSTSGDWVMLESTTYLGVGGLLVLLMAFQARQMAHWKFFAGAAITLLVVPATYLYWIPFKFFPGFSQTISTRLIFMLVLLFCILVGYGAHTILSSEQKIRNRLAICAGVLASCWWCALGALNVVRRNSPEYWVEKATELAQTGHIRFPFRTSYPTEEQFVKDVQLRFLDYYSAGNEAWLLTGTLLAILALGAVALRKRPHLLLYTLIGVTALDLVIFSTSFNSTTTLEFLTTPPPAVEFIKSEAKGRYRTLGLGTIRPNTTNPFHLVAMGGYNSIIPSDSVAFANALQNNDSTQTRGPFTAQTFPIKNIDSPLLNVASVRFVVSYPNQDLRGLGLRPVYQQPNGVKVWENPRALPLVWVATDVQRASDFEDALGLLNQPNRDLSQAVIQAETPSLDSSTSQPRPVVINQFHPGFWEVQAEGPGWLILGEAYDPGWSVSIDGAESQPTTRAQGMFQAVLLPEGQHTVQFAFAPPRLKIGLFVTLLSVLGIAVAFVLAWRVR